MINVILELISFLYFFELDSFKVNMLNNGIPIVHISYAEVLKKMRREANGNQEKNLVNQKVTNKMAKKTKL